MVAFRMDFSFISASYMTLCNVIPFVLHVAYYKIFFFPKHYGLKITAYTNMLYKLSNTQ